ncbi:hypothetical protein FRC14_000106 [Serendipita sp. 396]|nr:hypothetical protein FRC14_000106 [Serendipita sp. 396]KAG8879517.1 hypothetical protein FRC20_000089 [Serendipita sp. 405]
MDFSRSSLSNVLVVSGIVVLPLISWIGWTRSGSEKKDRRVYPPGPPQDPLIGNLRNFPKDKWGDTFCEWARLYGDITWVQMPGMNMAIINSYDIAQELLSKRANINSGRKVGYMALHLMGNERNLSFIQPGATHQFMRKLLRRGIGPSRIATHNHLIETSVASLMLTLKDLRGSPASALMNTMGSIVIPLTYGDEMWKTSGQEFLDWNAESMTYINLAFSRFWMVDVFHFLRFVPSWFPGSEFKRIGQRNTYLINLIRTQPYKRTLELYNAGKLGHCLATDLLDEFGPSEEVQDTLAVLYQAGAETTTNILVSFLHAMFLFPDISRKVYAEILSVTGGQRPLTIQDRPNLPYTQAVYKEALRWRPSAPVGLPHVSTEDDTINGYFLPKGTLIGQNFRFMLTDPKVYGDPENFRPERFLPEHNPEAETLPDPGSILFGFGMRVCPGMYLADRTGFHIAASTLSLFEVLPLEGQPAPKPDEVKYSTSAFCLPLGFECRFVPRDERARNMINALSMNL